MMISFRKYLTTTENHILVIMGYGFNDEHINVEIHDAIRNSNGALSVVIFYGGDKLPNSIQTWMSDGNIKSQVLVLGKRGIWKDGQELLNSEEDLEWYKFEKLSELISGVR